MRFTITSCLLKCSKKLVAFNQALWFKGNKLFLLISLFSFFRWYVWIIILSGEETTYADKYSTDIYNTPWSRIHVYMIGMLTGYILHVGRGKIRMNKASTVQRYEFIRIGVKGFSHSYFLCWCDTQTMS